MKRVKKGEYGYLSYEKKVTVIRTILYFALSIALYVIGYVTTKTNKNLLTVVAILGMLPASKSAVNMIMYLKAKGCSEAVWEKVLKKVPDKALYGLNVLYDLYFTSYQKNFQVSAAVIKGNCICALTEDAKCDSKAGEKHIEDMLTKNGIKGYTVKIFDNTDKFLDRMNQLIELEAEENPHAPELLALLSEITL